MTSTLNQIPSWTFKAEYVETCNCDYGCPCNFNGTPYNGLCRALALFHIRSRNYGDTSLDGIDVICAFSRPKAIHDGYDTAQLFISKFTSIEQRNSIITIFSGQPKGEGPFTLFAGTIKFFLEPPFVDIQVDIDYKKIALPFWISYRCSQKASLTRLPEKNKIQKYNYPKVLPGNLQRWQNQSNENYKSLPQL